MITALLERADLLLGVVAELVEDPGLDHLGRILLAVQHLVKDAVAIALGELGHVVGPLDHRLQGFLAHHHVVALEEHDAGRKAVALGVDERQRLPRSSNGPPRRTWCPSRCRRLEDPLGSCSSRLTGMIHNL